MTALDQPQSRESWPQSRASWLAFLGDRQLGLTDVIAARRRCEEVSLLVKEALVEQRGQTYRLTPQGQVMRVLHALNADEDGAWSITNMKRFAATKNMAPETLAASLDALQTRGLVVRRESKRSIKWELTGR